MSEISREEIIKNLSMVRASLDYLEIDEELEKVISDMEKLQKIEELFEHKSFGEYTSNYEDIAKEIRKILKGDL